MVQSRKEISKRYYDGHKEQCKKATYSWRARNLEKTREISRRSHAKHQDEILVYNQRYYLENMEEMRQRGRTDYHKDPIKSRKRQRDENARVKLSVLSAYSVDGKIQCLGCGISDTDVLCLDHINNNGVEDRRTIGQGTILYHWLEKHSFPKGYQVLCFNCNMKKRMELNRRKNE